MTLNDLEWRYSPYFAFFSPNSIANEQDTHDVGNIFINLQLLKRICRFPVFAGTMDTVQCFFVGLRLRLQG